MTEYNDYLTEYEDVYLRLSDMQSELERARQDAIPPCLLYTFSEPTRPY